LRSDLVRVCGREGGHRAHHEQTKETLADTGEAAAQHTQHVVLAVARVGVGEEPAHRILLLLLLHHSLLLALLGEGGLLDGGLVAGLVLVFGARLGIVDVALLVGLGEAHGLVVLLAVRLLLGRQLVELALLADGQQLIVCALLDDPAPLDEGDLVGAHDRREPVRDGDRREAALLHDVVERRLHDLLARVVERAGRLVEQHDARLLDDGTRDGDTLLLPARELAAAHAHLCAVALV